MTLGIAFSVATFHRSYPDGWIPLDGSVANLIISGNQLWCSQKGVTMIIFPPHFTSLLRTSCIIENKSTNLLFRTSLSFMTGKYSAPSGD